MSKDSSLDMLLAGLASYSVIFFLSINHSPFACAQFLKLFRLHRLGTLSQLFHHKCFVWFPLQLLTYYGATDRPDELS